MRRALIVLAALLAAACAPAGQPAPAATSPAATGSPAARAIWPLRGTPAPSADAIKRRPIVVRIGNEVAARPAAGLEKADVVLEILVEGGITRYAAVFHSEDADQIGPVRSGRLSDLHYLPMLRGILAHVGAQPEVLRRIRDAARGGAFVDVDQFEHAVAYDRVSSRAAPQNAFTSTQRIREAAARAGDKGAVDVPALAFAEKAEGGTPTTEIAIPYVADQRVTYTFDSQAYRRMQAGRETVDDASKKEVRPANIVVIKTEITEVPGLVEDEHGSLSLEIRTTGSGPVVVLRDGQRFDGTWTRQGSEMYRFQTASGGAIALRAGLTWIHVVPMSFELGAASGS